MTSKIILSCPRCGELVVASEALRHEATCPACGKAFDTAEMHANLRDDGSQDDTPRILTTTCSHCGQQNWLSAKRCTKCARSLRRVRGAPAIVGILAAMALGAFAIGSWLGVDWRQALSPDIRRAPTATAREKPAYTPADASKREPTTSRQGDDFLKVEVIDPDIGGGNIAFMAGKDKGLSVGQRLTVMSQGKPNGVVVVKSVLQEVSWGEVEGAAVPLREGDLVLVPR